MSSVFTIENRYRPSYFALLIYLLLLKAVVMGLIIAAYNIHLSPDEAQYWMWSQQLDWGYYSKPPAIAWQIWMTTLVFGHQEFGVRVGSIIIGFLLVLTVYHLAQSCRLSERVSFWAAVVMAFSPIGIFFSFAATTDPGATLFLTLAIAEIARGLEEEQQPRYALAGVWILLGALYKWTTYILWPITFVMMLFHPKLRKLSIIWGVLISLLALLPSVYWNASHDWATFKHVGGNFYHPGRTGNVIDFLASQIGIVSPILFVLLVVSFFYLKKPSLVYLSLFPFVILFYFVTSFFKKMQPNWGDYLYPPAMVLIAWVALEKIRLGRLWLHLGIWLSIIGTFVALSIPWLQEHNVFSQHQISYKANPFRQSMGWERLGPALTQAGYCATADTFLFGDRYQTTSLLSFYAPEDNRTYFFNLNQQRKNQFSYGIRMEDCEVGKTGYFVVIENAKPESLHWYETCYPEKLHPYFEQVTHVGNYPLFTAYGRNVKYAMVFRCEHYLGTCPKDPEKY
ncbi:MAG: glycosyltransferase family 39 protein [Verrucomicrobia bacterium]|nr:glycosyltransferase family 39 protein [Verrucomicrobiota bacterium]MBS0645394.1 glycosyltransferase family 39 protein [Verrucomicrobiota bacterium]